MRVAVIVPCFNDGHLVTEAVASLDSATEPLEVVVVDDGSSDARTLTVLDELRERGVNVIRQENTGLSGARMAGLAATTAPYVFPLDADDQAVGETLGALADRLDADPGLAVCFADYVEFGEGEELARAVPERLDPYRIAYVNEYPVTSLYRRTALEQAGGWRAIRWGYEDWDLWMGLAEQGLVGAHVGAGRVSHRRRLHGERMLAGAKRNHRTLYKELRSRHPEHRRRSDLSPMRKLLYPLVYGGRPRFAVEAHAKTLLDRLGVWTLRR
jgi:glycosyltransferase involved in cell wall biosynthesis